jgi:hypothetical protein
MEKKCTKNLHPALADFQLKNKEKRKKKEEGRNPRPARTKPMVQNRPSRPAMETLCWVSPAMGLQDPRFFFPLPVV